MNSTLRLTAAMDRLVPAWRHTPGIVAVSGGADSVALFRLLRNPADIVVVHVNHQLRGDESDADEAFVVNLAERFGATAFTQRIPITSGNIEDEARKARYAFFDKVADEVGALWIATAHTLDDQAETVLHRLIRGTGLQGLKGIHQNGGTAVPQLVRPLLDIRRVELREHLRSIDQPFREDSSNADPRFTRNRIRHELLPLLETFNPQIANALSRLSMQASEWGELLESETANQLKRCELPRAGSTLVFDATMLVELAEPQRRAVLRMAWQREGWPEQGMTFAHWQRLAELGTHDFPGGVRSNHRGRVFQLQGDSRRPAF